MKDILCPIYYVFFIGSSYSLVEALFIGSFLIQTPGEMLCMSDCNYYAHLPFLDKVDLCSFKLWVCEEGVFVIKHDIIT